MRNFANFRRMRFFAKCEFSHANFSQNAIFRKMRIFAKCDFSHAIFSHNANFECNFRMRIFKGDYRMQKLVTSWPKISHSVPRSPWSKNFRKKIEKCISKNLTIRQFWLIFSEMSAPQAENPTTRAWTKNPSIRVSPKTADFEIFLSKFRKSENFFSHYKIFGNLTSQ